MIGIVAIAKNKVIGHHNSMPWRCPEDLSFFKEMTIGKTIVMGRKTFNSIGKFLPNRTTLVMTRSPEKHYETSSIPDGEVFLCGGAELYTQFTKECEEFYVTELDIEVDGDVFFPTEELSVFKRKTLLREGFSNEINYKIYVYQR